MIVGGYSLHLYCDTGSPDGSAVGEDCPYKPALSSLSDEGDIYGASRRDCMAQARKRGWTFPIGSNSGEMRAICPRCSKDAKKKLSPVAK